MRYRRAAVPGATYFITANLADRTSSLLLSQIAVFRAAVQHVKARHHFHIDAMAVMPDHFHLLMTLPEGDANFSVRVGTIKSTFSRHLPKTEHEGSSRMAKRERGIWQRRFWEHLIRDDNDFARHVDYIHFNPVKHGFVQRASEWPHSSIHRYIAGGLMGRDWATSIMVQDLERNDVGQMSRAQPTKWPMGAA